MVREVAHALKRTPLSDLNKILHGGTYPDVITYTNFGEDRLRSLGVAGVKVCPSPLTLIVALTTLSHYRASVCYHNNPGVPVIMTHRAYSIPWSYN